MKQLRIFIILLSAFAAGCGTYSKKQCREMDWYVQGKKSALDGFTPKQGKTHFIDKCQEDHGVAVDVVDFDRGFTSGLNKLCTPEGLEELKDKGVKYQRTCDSHQDSLSSTQTRTAELEAKILKLEAEITRLKKDNERLGTEQCPEHSQ